MKELILNKEEFISINYEDEFYLMDDTWRRTLLLKNDFEIFSDLASDEMLKAFHVALFKEFDFIVIDSNDNVYGLKVEIKTLFGNREDSFEYYSKKFPLNVRTT